MFRFLLRVVPGLQLALPLAAAATVAVGMAPPDQRWLWEAELATGAVLFLWITRRGDGEPLSRPIWRR